MTSQPTLTADGRDVLAVHDDTIVVPDAVLSAGQVRHLLKAVPDARTGQTDGRHELYLPLDTSPFVLPTLADVVLSSRDLTVRTPPELRRRFTDALLTQARHVVASSALAPPSGYREATLPRLPAPIAERVHDYQLAALWYVDHVAGGRAFLGDDPGAGKTLAMLGSVALRGGPTCIVCKSTLKSVMEDEVYKWVSPDARVHVLDGQKATGIDPEAEFVIVNYEILHHRLDELEAFPFRAAAFDESQMMKSEGVDDEAAREWMAMDADERKASRKKKPQGAWRTWAAGQITRGPDIDTVLLLSATPAPNGRHVEWMPQLDVLGVLDHFGGKPAFEERYTRRCIQCIEAQATWCTHSPKARFNMKGRQVPNTFGSINPRELSDRLRSSVMVRRSQLQIMPYLDPITPMTARLPLSSKGGAEYRRVEREFKEWLKDYAARKAREDGTSVKQAIAQAMRNASGEHEALIQMTHLRQAAARAKMPAVIDYLMDLIAEDQDTHIPRKAVVFAWHRDIQAELIEALDPVVAEYRTRHIDDSRTRKAHVAAYPGVPRILAATDMSRDQIREHTRRFQDDPEEPVIVCSLAAAAEGHTLDSGFHVVFAEDPWQPAVMRQAAGRAFGRASNPHTITAHFLRGQGTVDEELAAKLDEKKAVMAATLDEGRELEWAEPREGEPGTAQVQAGTLLALLGDG